MKRFRITILISVCLFSINNQVFAMGSKLPSLGNLVTSLSSANKSPTTSPATTTTTTQPTTSTGVMSSIINKLPSLMSLIPLGPIPMVTSLLPSLLSKIPTWISKIRSFFGGSKSSIAEAPTSIAQAPAPVIESPAPVISAPASAVSPSVPVPTVAVNPEPPSAAIPTQGGGAYIDQIKTLAENSTCANYSWKSRGQAPVGYINGVALSFARSLCRLKTKSALSQIMSSKSSGNDALDALTHYQTNFSALPISVTAEGQEPLRAVYVLGMGLGMRESSGSYCEGWDRSAGSGRSSSAAEAGVFQTSYDSIGSSPELSKLYAEYKANPNRCFLDVFKEGASCSSSSILGTGAGAEYQAFNKACPAFATEYAMVMLRIQRGHYGPINRKEAEVVPACNQLLKSVQDLINNDPYACQDII